MRENKSYYRTCQRADKPDELAMIALNNPEFGKRLIKEFNKAKGGLSCLQQK
ncbi:hypothetical protein [Gilliamella apicola]|uniref:hypothetical protein n=1 Tax=Gilliamella apicola TaxID=1196095 RepID=UPI002FEE3A84